MSELNVERIMEEIRSEIKEKGYTKDMLDFDDVIVADEEVAVEKFERTRFNEELSNLNTLWNVNPVRPIEKRTGIKGRCICLYRKIVRRCIRSYLSPIVWEQDTFNATTVRLMNMLNLYMEENRKLIEEVERLSNEQRALTEKFNKFSVLNGKRE